MRRVRFKAEEILGRDLRPGDLFSTAGPEVWDHVDTRGSIGEKLYVRTNVTEEQAKDGHLPIYRVTLEIVEADGEPEPLGDCPCGSPAVAWLDGEALCPACHDGLLQIKEKAERAGCSARIVLRHSDGTVARSGSKFLKDLRGVAADGDDHEEGVE